MSRWLIGGGMALAAALALTTVREPLSAAPPEEATFVKDAAVRVICKGNAAGYFLTRPRAVWVGDRAFLHGYRVDGSSAVYVPVYEIDLIEEFSSEAKLKAEYSLGPRVDPRKATTTEGK
jgi:hypothetical protein